MKKTVCVLSLCLLSMAFIFAETMPAADTSAQAEQTNGTVVTQTTQSTETTTSETPVTFDAEKVKLAPQQKVAWPIVLNILPGLGIGSFVQHDILGGFIGLGLSAGAIACGVIGYAYFVTAILVVALSKDESLLDCSLCLFGGAIAFEVGNIVWGIVRPLKFRDRYNAKQNVASTAKPTTSLSFIPIVAPDRVGAVAVLKY